MCLFFVVIQFEFMRFEFVAIVVVLLFFVFNFEISMFFCFNECMTFRIIKC